MPVQSLRFPPFELQPTQRRLLRNGVPVLLRARAFDLLLVLVERAGDLVTKDELLALVWPGLVVEENNIAAQVVSLRKVIGSERIATIAGRGYRFAASVERVESAPPTVAASSSASAPSNLIGRDDDLARLRATLATGRCVTLVGPGGVGKTVLAREAAASFARRAWVDLAALADGSRIVGALYRALDVAPSDAAFETDASLAAALADAERLVVFDNAEHLADAMAALVIALHALAPTLPILVTSQVPLRTSGEHVQSVEPLALPLETQSDDESVASPAVRLLLERLRASDPTTATTPDRIALMRRLVVHLDGLPLALEMAAAMVPMLGLSGVLDALDQRFAVLRRGRRDADARHQTLRAAIAWSHDLLEPDAQRVFARLGVFPDAFALDLGLAAVGDDGADRWATLDVLTELVERSLVVRLPTDPPRFRLLETMRSFAVDALRASGDEATARNKVVTALTAYLRESEPATRGALELAHVAELAAWARACAPAAAIELTLAASGVAVWTSWLREAASWLEACEPLLDETIPLAMQAAWWREFARYQTFVRGRRAVEAARKACVLERTLGNDDGLFWSLIPLLRSRVLDADEFETLREEAQALLARHPVWSPRHRVVFSGSLAMEYRRRGDFARAWTYQRDEADEAERAGLRQVADNAQVNLVATLVGLGRMDEALDRIATLLAQHGDVASPVIAHLRLQRINALTGLGRFDDAQAEAPAALADARRYDILDVFQILAILAAQRGRMREAALLVGHFRQRLAARGADLPEDVHAPWREASRLVAGAFDAATVKGLTERGAQLTADEVDAAALGEAEDLRTRTA